MKKNTKITINNTNYTLIESIGNGGSGDVWKAKSNGIEYAVKFLKSDSNEKIARFKNEIEFCKESNHKNIVKLIDDGEEDGRLYYIMPLYQKTFRTLINTENDVNVLISFILKLCSALKYIHKKEIFHRDIKPENILINNNDLVLADFGIAHFKESNLTKEGNLLVNRNYVAPEQKDKKNAPHLTEAVDIFALGLIINECFTKQIPSGSDINLIANIQPLYGDLDNLVANMIKQDPNERLTIDSVITEIKFIHFKIKQSLKEISISLKGKMKLQGKMKAVSKTIQQRANEDILFGKVLFQSKSAEELNKYNLNWHMKIKYSVDEFLYNLYIQERIYSACKSKFEYESNCYSRDKWYNVLDLENNKKNLSLYQQINCILEKYKLSSKSENSFNLSGKILKYFASCADYHCEEILNNIKDIESSAKRNLKDAPIIQIAYTLKFNIKQNIDCLLNGNVSKHDFNFAEHIDISSRSIDTYLQNHDDLELFDIQYLEEQRQLKEILSEFEKKWKVFCYKLNEDEYSVRFRTYKQYEKFRKHARELSKNYYIFESDVIEFLKNPNFFGTMVELKFGAIFDIPHTIAKILGLREINH